MQPSALSIRLFGFVSNDIGAFKRPIHSIALCMLLLAGGGKRLAIKSEDRAHPSFSEVS